MAFEMSGFLGKTPIELKAEIAALDAKIAKFEKIEREATARARKLSAEQAKEVIAHEQSLGQWGAIANIATAVLQAGSQAYAARQQSKQAKQARAQAAAELKAAQEQQKHEMEMAKQQSEAQAKQTQLEAKLAPQLAIAKGKMPMSILSKAPIVTYAIIGTAGIALLGAVFLLVRRRN